MGGAAPSHQKRDLGGGSLQKERTDPTARDSDADGLWDGDELLVATLDGIDQRGFKSDPSEFDSDGDHLSDGQEIQGWTINIVHEKTKDKVAERRVFSDPLRVQTDDYNGDGVVDSRDASDFSEFQNTSDPNLKDTDGDAILDSFEELGGHWQIEGKDPETMGESSPSSSPTPGMPAFSSGRFQGEVLIPVARFRMDESQDSTRTATRRGIHRDCSGDAGMHHGG